jgi:O-antigen/teichoic acid export membrane protein
VVVLDGLAAFFHGVFRLRNELKPMALGEIVRAVVVLGMFTAWEPPSARSAIVAYLMGALAGCLIPLALLARRRELMRPRFELAPILSLARPAIVISLASATYVIGNRLDVVILDFYRGPSEVGLYNSAYTFLTNLSTIPLLASAVVFPSLAALSSEDAESSRLLRIALAPLIAMGIPIMICGPIVANGLIASIYGSDYLPAGPVLAVLLIPAGIIFLGSFLWQVLIARDKQGHTLLFTAVALSTNVAINLVLVPRIGAVGAAWATAAMEALLLVLPLILLRNLMSLADLGRLALSPVICALLTAIVVQPFRDIQAVLLLPVIVLIYMGSLCILSSPALLGRMSGFPFALNTPVRVGVSENVPSRPVE